MKKEISKEQHKPRIYRKCYKYNNVYYFIISSKNEKVKFQWIKNNDNKQEKNSLFETLINHENDLIRASTYYIVYSIYHRKNSTIKKHVIDLNEIFSNNDDINNDNAFKLADKIEFIMPKEHKLVISAIKRGRNVMIVGPSGCGKSRMVIELAKQYNAKLYRTNVNAGTTDASLIGEKSLDIDSTTNQTITKFTYGIVPRAMKEGAWLLIDEIDFMQPEYLASLQAILEGDGTPLIINDNGGEIIYPHKNFRLIATANTLGRGDTFGYHGTNILNIATLDRWAIFKMNYCDKEKQLVEKIVGEEMAEKIMLVAQRVRESIKQGNLPDMVMSTRRLLHWAEAIKDETLSFKEATELELLGRLTFEEREIIEEYVKDAFGSIYNS